MEPSVAMQTAEHVLLNTGLILGAGAICGFLAQMIKVPDIVLYLLVGMVLGPQVTGLLDIGAGSALNQLILIFGASYILFDGGATLRLKVLKEVWITLVIIATIGVLISAFITGLAAQYVLGLPFITALLLGSAMAPTDPATLVPVFKQVKIKDRVAQTVMSESAFNDAMGAIITFTILAVAMGSGEFSLVGSLENLFWEAGLGIVAGAILGYLALLLIAHERYAFLREYMPVVSLLVVLGAYLGAAHVHSSGFMAVFIAGIMIGNKDVFGFAIEPGEEEGLVEYIETTALIMRMFIFILLGSQVDFSLLSANLTGGVIVVAVFMFIARPVTVFACALVDRRAKWEFKEMLFMCWTRETGVIPGALAGLLMGMNAPGARVIASVVFIAILATILIQATTTKWLAKKLDLLAE